MSLPQIATQVAGSLATTNISDAIPISPVLSSEQQGWNGIIVEQRHHPPSEIVVPAVSEHIITLHLKHRTNLIQKRDGRVYEKRVTPGHISLTPAGQPSNWCWDKTSEVLHLRLNPTFLLKNASEACGLDSNRVELLSYFSIRDSQLEQIGLALLGELHSKGLGGQLYVESLINLLSIHLLRHYSALRQLTPISTASVSYAHLQQVLEYIHDNLAQNLTLTELAQIAGLSSSHLVAQFQKWLGVAPHQYIIQCRVEWAKRLLLQGRLSISEIATHVGFYDQSHFTRHMKRLMGVTPKAILHNQNVLNK
ncbi:AraC family transcriptional regulator [Calothrix sp. NIES-4071]|nr:AraC family transcriptional regulator [Calothrix sp. NIES-4071]BAZ57958.1 AraC family transcriptional regulator [Calothrix sp. NIES-4105]